MQILIILLNIEIRSIDMEIIYNIKIEILKFYHWMIELNLRINLY